MMLSLISLSIPMFLPCFHNLHFLLSILLIPIDNFEICDSNVEMGNKDNVLNMLGRSDENFEPLGYFSGCDTALDPYCINLVDKPGKILSNTFFDSSFDFSMALALIKRALTFFTLILSCSLTVKLGNSILRSLTRF